MTYKRRSRDRGQRADEVKPPKRLRKLIEELRSVRRSISYAIEYRRTSSHSSLDLFANSLGTDDSIIEFDDSVLVLPDEDSFVWKLIVKERRLQKQIATFHAVPPIPSAIVEISSESDFQHKCVVLAPDFETVNTELLAYFAKHPREMERLHWRKFEEVIESIFRALGYQTRVGAWARRRRNRHLGDSEFSDRTNGNVDPGQTIPLGQQGKP